MLRKTAISSRQNGASRFGDCGPCLAITILVVGILSILTLGAPPAGQSESPSTPVLRASRTPELPVVRRPVPRQGSVGLAADSHLDKTPPRQTKGLDLVKMGWSYDCMECHQLLQAKWHYDRPMAEHSDIELDHGNNRFCLNCHHSTNRNAFVDYDGSEIHEGEVVLLCAKCHGPTHRDWKAGVHGRRNGFWNVSKGLQTRLRCIQCHDPHRPAFQPTKPLAPLRYPPRAPHPASHLSALTQTAPGSPAKSTHP